MNSNANIWLLPTIYPKPALVDITGTFTLIDGTAFIWIWALWRLNNWRICAFVFSKLHCRQTWHGLTYNSPPDTYTKRCCKIVCKKGLTKQTDWKVKKSTKITCKRLQAQRGTSNHSISKILYLFCGIFAKFNLALLLSCWLQLTSRWRIKELERFGIVLLIADT